MKARLLVIDDDKNVIDLVTSILEAEKTDKYEVSTVGSAEELLKTFEQTAPDVVLLDLKLGSDNGLDLLPQLKKHWPSTQVIMLTGHATVDAALEAGQKGAFYFQPKPFQAKELVLMVKRAWEHKQLLDERLHKTIGKFGVFESPIMKKVVRTIERVAPTEVSVLITGESGTGKEVISDMIHELSASPRCEGPLIKINCAALPRELIESELFGSVKGAYTGATSDREGLFRQAEGGTLVLDELSEMPIDTQSKLLRVLQEKEVRPVGGRTTYKTNARIIAATNRKTDEAIRDGKLREDLFYRISAITVHLPPLRERREDIVSLANYFLKHYSSQAGRFISGYSKDALDRIRVYDWPGNVRQLQNEVQHAVLMSEAAEVQASDLSIRPDDKPDPGDTNFTLMEGIERNAIIQMLKETGGNKLETARRLGIGRQTLYNKIKAYDIQV
jgi:DNA-binding NtrC family response regulator